jgi:hypothetical protein
MVKNGTHLERVIDLLTTRIVESLDEFDFEVFKNFFKEKFEGVNKNEAKGIYVHYTTSTDTELMKTVINVIM